MPTAACGRRNIARRISYISRYTHQDTKSCTSSITLSFTRLPSTTVGFGRYRKAFRWGTPRPRLRNVPVTYEQFAPRLADEEEPHRIQQQWREYCCSSTKQYCSSL